MRYTVVWVESAEQELAALWMAAPDRAAVNGAVLMIDDELRTDAHAKGRPADGARILVAPPLIVFFEVSEADRIARVLQVNHQ